MNISNYLISNGIPETTVFLLLALPFISLLVSFFRHFVGVKTFGMYEPIVIAYSLFFISEDFWVGLKFGLPILLIAWVVSEILKRFLEKARLHYISKVSLKISIASILMIALLFSAVYFNKNGYFTVSALPIVIIIALVESLSLFQIKAGSLKANILTLETLLVSFVGYLLLSVNVLQTFLINYPYVVILPVVGNFFVGRWDGLRLTEYLRFRSSLKDD
jgi:hypothetical protein